jgi:hypothetical protein
MMKRAEQKQFVDDLTKNIADSIKETIDNGKLPEEWDGIELRMLIAARANNATYGTTRQRRSDFKNTVLVNNLD